MILTRLLSLAVVTFALLGTACSVTEPAGATDPAETALVANAEGYEVPERVGLGSLTVRNEHTAPVGFRFFHLDDGADLERFLAHLGGDHPGQAPYDVVADLATVAPGAEVVLADGLEAGAYVVASLAPDDDAGWAPQFLTGHLAEFTVG
ncbi:MAG: hypothetical protein AAF081_10715 [Actinomycetota bacterium]